jgi:hypothetical protein
MIPVALLASLVGGLVLVGCGGSSSAEPLKKPQFAREANSICQEAEAERAKALKNTASSQSGLAELTTIALPPIQKMTEELGELGVPVGDDKEVDAIIAAFEKGVERVEADPANLDAAVVAFAEANKLAEDYGLADCAI